MTVHCQGGHNTLQEEGVVRSEEGVTNDGPLSGGPPHPAGRGGQVRASGVKSPWQGKGEGEG